MVVDFFYGQTRLPHSVTLPRMRLPEGAVIVSGSFHMHWPGGCLMMLVQHKSFDIVPVGAEPPYFDGGEPELWMYGLATEEEMAARRMKPREESDPEPVIAQGIKMMGCKATLLGMHCSQPRGHAGPHTYNGGEVEERPYPRE